MAVPLVVGGVQSLQPDSSTFLEELTSGIRFYLREMGKHVIEIGKRLILAKELVQYGDWQSWLDDNFNLSLRTARQFMQIAERFGKKSDSQEWQTSAVLNQSQMVEMLSLPEGEEEKFIAEQAAEGRIVAEMSVKTLRVEIQKYKARLAAVNGGVESSVSVERALVSIDKVEESVQAEDCSSVESVEDTVAVEKVFESVSDAGVIVNSVSVSASGDDDQRVGQNLLEQFFGMMKALASGGNLQNLVAQSASKDIQALKAQLNQFAALYGDIQAHLSQWQIDNDTVVDETAVGEDVETVEENVVAETDVEVRIVAGNWSVAVDKGGDNENSLESFVGKICDKESVNIDESDRHSIISALYQIALNDDENFTRTEYMASLMEGKGFEIVHQMSTKDLYNVLYLVAVKFCIYT